METVMDVEVETLQIRDSQVASGDTDDHSSCSNVGLQEMRVLIIWEKTGRYTPQSKNHIMQL